jgi:hypothetical protein
MASEHDNWNLHPLSHEVGYDDVNWGCFILNVGIKG